MSIHPKLCAAAGCDHMGEALIEQYAPVERIGGIQILGATGEWIWLCGPHAVQEFS